MQFSQHLTGGQLPRNLSSGAPKQVSAEELTLQLSTALADLNATLDSAERQLTHLRGLRVTLNSTLNEHEARMSSILSQNNVGMGAQAMPSMVGRR